MQQSNIVIMSPNPKCTCTFYTNGSSGLELHFRGIVSTTSTEGNLLVLWLGHCAMGWDNGLVSSLETAENELRFSAFLARRLLLLLSPEKRDWSLLSAFRKQFGENPGKLVSVSWQHRTTCHRAGDGQDFRPTSVLSFS